MKIVNSALLLLIGNDSMVWLCSTDPKSCYLLLTMCNKSDGECIFSDHTEQSLRTDAPQIVSY
jgi:hypothetical protein